LIKCLVGGFDQISGLFFATFIEFLVGKQNKQIRIIFSNGRRFEERSCEPPGTEAFHQACQNCMLCLGDWFVQGCYSLRAHADLPSIRVDKESTRVTGDAGLPGESLKCSFMMAPSRKTLICRANFDATLGFICESRLQSRFRDIFHGVKRERLDVDRERVSVTGNFMSYASHFE
jgi:hypothetical protein